MFRQINGKKIVAMDCEMVGSYQNGEEINMLARVTIIDFDGSILLDTFVAPIHPVTDYRTRFSGVTESSLKNAPSFENVQENVQTIIKPCILVGHSLRDDFAVLNFSHEKMFTRDTAEWNFLAKKYTDGFRPSLKKLARVVLGRDIQRHQHSSKIDATATLDLYKKFQESWEKEF